MSQQQKSENCQYCFNFGHSSKCIVVCILFLLMFSWWHITCLHMLRISASCLLMYLLRSLAHSKFSCFCCKVLSVIYIFWTRIFTLHRYFENIFPSLLSISQSLDSIFCKAEILNFNEVQFISSFTDCAFSVVPTKSSSNSKLCKFSPLLFSVF